MLWVGGSIIIHGLEEVGFAAPAHVIYDIAAAIGHFVSQSFAGFAEWFSKAAIDGVLGLGLGLVLIPPGERVVTPIWRKVFSN